MPTGVVAARAGRSVFRHLASLDSKQGHWDNVVARGPQMAGWVCEWVRRFFCCRSVDRLVRGTRDQQIERRTLGEQTACCCSSSKSLSAQNGARSRCAYSDAHLFFPLLSPLLTVPLFPRPRLKACPILQSIWRLGSKIWTRNQIQASQLSRSKKGGTAAHFSLLVTVIRYRLDECPSLWLPSLLHLFIACRIPGHVFVFFLVF